MVGTQESDFGTPETQYHGGGITKGYNAQNEKVGRVNKQAPVDVLYHRGCIGDRQWQAAEYLRRDAKASGKFAYVRSSADFSVSGTVTEEAAEFITDARARYNRAIGCLDRYEEAVVSLVVIEEGYIKWITERKLRINGMGILRSGLDTLIKFYGV